MTTRQALVIAVAGTIPGVGGILSTLLQEMTDKIENNEDLKNQCDLLRDKLPKLVKELEDYEDPSALILRVLQNARGLNNVVQARKRTRKRDLFLKREARESLKEFEDQFTTFKRDLENLTTDMIIRIHYDTYITRGKVDDLNNKMDGQSNQLGRQSDLLIKIISLVQELGTKLIDDIPEANLARYQFDLSKALNGFGGGSDEERKQAQRTLIHLSMKLVRYGNESSLTILEELTMDSNAWPVIMKNGSLVEALLEVATKLSSEVEKNIVSRILVKLAAEPGPFFEQLVKPYPPLMWTHTQGALQPKLNERHHAIKDTNLIPEIVIYSSSDENALRVLYEVSKTDYCKAAIAQEGGLSEEACGE
ncbi:hypothetical protein BBO99_00002706 [Phytophthora kernoviae]|uniref:Uncharacterized protein n=2 Tax=Phytophthora kernoviae TaxID=325452 RepID=A0A3R7G4Y8_9STRA|nr:hypothetical protein G195_009665 [Phytophthora kernoviae 00238/432]KAG2517375.1 hypothetical protein JM18_007784 [Phytophthora kernoviae]KAG2527963.1 hypothetical protein JM16_002431 [Phytophthora kernoviae]RLN36637.1 hypothetical protein BBI17_002655 [Phytophthora kernoviae]RLN82730.1 hypothetical protein BBO99_00002706 [Phytophthora kernoviae]